MILYFNDHKVSTRRLRSVKHFQQSSRIQINIQKLLAFLYTNNEHTKNEIRRPTFSVTASYTYMKKYNQTDGRPLQ
jgi:hypothetical protein